MNTPPPFEVKWVAADGTEITQANNDPALQPASARRSLAAGQRGQLRLRNNLGSFNPGDEMTVVFYWIRRAKTEMDLDALLTFDAPLLAEDPALGFPKVIKIRDIRMGIDKPQTNLVDGIRFTFTAADAGPSTSLGFTVNTNATNTYKSIGDGTHGMFWVDVSPPRGSAISMFRHGAALL